MNKARIPGNESLETRATEQLDLFGLAQNSLNIVSMKISFSRKYGKSHTPWKRFDRPFSLELSSHSLWFQSMQLLLPSFASSVHSSRDTSLTHSCCKCATCNVRQAYFIRGTWTSFRAKPDLLRKLPKGGPCTLKSESDLFGKMIRPKKSLARHKPFASQPTAEEGFVLEELDYEEEGVDDHSSSSRLPGLYLFCTICRQAFHSFFVSSVLLLERPARIDQKRKLTWNDLFLVLVLIAVVYAVVSTFSHVFTGVSPSELEINTNPKWLPW